MSSNKMVFGSNVASCSLIQFIKMQFDAISFSTFNIQLCTYFDFPLFVLRFARSIQWCPVSRMCWCILVQNASLIVVNFFLLLFRLRFRLFFARVSSAYLAFRQLPIRGIVNLCCL